MYSHLLKLEQFLLRLINSSVICPLNEKSVIVAYCYDDIVNTEVELISYMLLKLCTWVAAVYAVFSFE